MKLWKKVDNRPGIKKNNNPKALPGPVNRALWLQMENNAFKRQKNEFVTAPTKKMLEIKNSQFF